MFELFIIIASSIVVSLSILIKALFFTTELKRKLGLFLISFALAGFTFAIIYPNFTYRPHHCNCKGGIESEANNIAAAISGYFALPSRTQVPSISDLVNSGDYVLLENRDSKRRAKLVEESEFSVAILGDNVNEITIVVSSKEGRCPFEKGKCLWSKGKIYVKRMGDSEGSEGWLESWEEI